MDKEPAGRELENMDESERWRSERRRLNSEIDKLEAELADAKSMASRKHAADKSPGADPLATARVQEAAEEKIKRAAEEFEAEKAKLNSKINRLEGALAEAIARSSNPLRMTQSVKEQFEVELNRVAKEKTDIEQAFLRAKTEWEQEKLKMTGEAVKLRRAAQIMGRPIPKDDVADTNPKVRDLESQLQENLAQWNREREKLTLQIQKLNDASRAWDAERRTLHDHAAQLQEAFVKAEAKIQSLEVAARKPSPAIEQVDELRNENKELQAELDKTQDALDAERSQFESKIAELEHHIKQLMRDLETSGNTAETQAELNTLRRENDTMQRQLKQTQQAWDEQKQHLESEAAQLKEQLKRLSQTSERASNGVVEQLRSQYEERLQEAIREKIQLARELQNASTLLESERSRLANAQKDGGTGLDRTAIDKEVARIESQLNEIVAIIEDPSSELSTVIRKNVEKAELDSYLRGILFALGRK